MNFGLKNRDIETIHGILQKFPEVSVVKIFGSRAKGNFKPGSDIDLAVMNEGVSDETISKILSEFENSSLPYFVDLIGVQSLKHIELKEHIERVGIVFFTRHSA